MGISGLVFPSALSRSLEDIEISVGFVARAEATNRLSGRRDKASWCAFTGPLQSVHYGLTNGIVNNIWRRSKNHSEHLRGKSLMPTRVGAGSRTKRTQAEKAAPSGRSSARREGHLIGYARVSTTGQDTATQEAKLTAAGCTLIRTEAVSGGPRNGRSELASILDFIRSGDVLIVVKLDRLGRNTRDVLNLVHELEEKGASLRVLEPTIDTGGPMGRMILTVWHGRRDGAWLHP